MSMLAITTKYHSPTTTRGSRITATADRDHKITIPYPHEATNPHREAAEALIRKYPFLSGSWVEGYTDGGKVFVNLVSPAFFVNARDGGE